MTISDDMARSSATAVLAHVAHEVGLQQSAARVAFGSVSTIGSIPLLGNSFALFARLLHRYIRTASYTERAALVAVSADAAAPKNGNRRTL